MVEPSLGAAIDELYGTFGRYRLPDATDACVHCHDAAEQGRLHQHPLRELPADDLARFALSALTTWGDARHFKHFLPRIFEIAVGEGFVWPSLEVVFGKLSLASWQDWEPAEQEAVERLFQALWQVTLRRYPSRPGLEVDTVVTAIGQAVDDLRPYLDAWLDAPDEASMRQLAEFVSVNGSALATKHRLGNAFWRTSWAADRQRQVLGWLVQGDVVRAALTAAFFAASGDEVATELSDAVGILERREASRLPAASKRR